MRIERMWIMKWFFMAVMIAALAGCSREAREAADEAVDDVILQKTTIEAGQAAKQKVQEINAIRRESFKEMEE